ncbi:hypothetical protein WN943_011345 [Citrus x changshan-huyou]
MSRCHGRINAAVSTLLIAYIVLSVCSCPLLIEARIQNFSAIQGSLVHQSKKEGLDHRRRMRQVPKPDPSSPKNGYGGGTVPICRKFFRLFGATGMEQLRIPLYLTAFVDWPEGRFGLKWLKNFKVVSCTPAIVGPVPEIFRLFGANDMEQLRMPLSLTAFVDWPDGRFGLKWLKKFKIVSCTPSPYEKCKEIVQHEWHVKSNWSCEDPISRFKKAAKDSLAELQLWSKEEFQGREKKVQKLIEKLKAYRESNNQYVNGIEIQSLKGQIDDLLTDEEIYWRQRSRAVWLWEGDCNTKFFHSKATSRKRKNMIRGIIDDNNQWTEEADEIEKMFCECFDNLFASNNPTRHQMESALKDMPRKISNEMNAQLEQLYTEADVIEALSQMHSTKAPGLNGLPAAFFQKHWKHVSQGVIATCLHILNDEEVFTNLIPQAESQKQIHGINSRSILWGREVVERGLRWGIGNGEQDDAEQIIKIPLQKQLKPDQVLWHYDKMGEYSVKSGYQLALKMKFPDKPSCSDEKQNTWNAIWYLQIPEKRFNKTEVTILHALFECKASKRICQLTCFEENVRLNKIRDDFSLFQAMLGKRTKAEMELMVVAYWSIWHSRNLLIFKNKREYSQSSVAAAEAMVQAYRKIQIPQMQEISKQSNVV